MGALFSGLIARRGIARPQGLSPKFGTSPFVGDRPHDRPDGQQRADDRLDVGGLDIALRDEGDAYDDQDLPDES
jgi:hypothetical protein